MRAPLKRCAACGKLGAMILATTRADDPARLCGSCDQLERERRAAAADRRRLIVDTVVLSVAAAIGLVLLGLAGWLGAGP